MKLSFQSFKLIQFELFLKKLELQLVPVKVVRVHVLGIPLHKVCGTVSTVAFQIVMIVTICKGFVVTNKRPPKSIPGRKVIQRVLAAVVGLLKDLGSVVQIQLERLTVAYILAFCRAADWRRSVIVDLILVLALVTVDILVS